MVQIKNKTVNKVKRTDLLFLVVDDAVSAGDVFGETLGLHAADVAHGRFPLHLQYRPILHTDLSTDKHNKHTPQQQTRTLI